MKTYLKGLEERKGDYLHQIYVKRTGDGYRGKEGMVAGILLVVLAFGSLFF